MLTLRREAGFLGLVAAAALGGCSGGTSAVAGTAVRDSAGVRIVESGSPEWGETPRWRIDPEPLLDLGSADGEEPFLFDYVETALRRPDGTIVVANAGSGELRFFDSKGRFVRAAGRKGGGPGEFSGNSTVHIWFAANGDIIANDVGNRRVLVFDSAGTLRTSTVLAPPPEQGRPSIQDEFANGDWLVMTSLRDEPPSGAIHEGHRQYHRYSAGGGPIGRYPVVSNGRLIAVGAGKIMSFFRLPFDPEAFAVAAGDDMLLSQDGANRIDRYAADGRLVASYRWDAPRRSTADVYDAWRRDDLASVDSANRPLVERYQSVASSNLPERVPGPIRAIVDVAGNAWLQRYYLNSETARLNDILSPDGRWLGTVALPPGGWLLQAGTDFVLLWTRDDLGVEHVRLHRLDRGT